MFFPVQAPDGTEVLPLYDDGRKAVAGCRWQFDTWPTPNLRWRIGRAVTVTAADRDPERGSQVGVGEEPALTFRDELLDGWAQRVHVTLHILPGPAHQPRRTRL